MKRLICITLCLLTGATSVSADDSRAYLGVLLDPVELPPLLNLHLGLAEGQGLRVQNLHKDSPADRAGIERHDILIALEGDPIMDLETFVEQISQSKIGRSISLELIHKGKNKQVPVTLIERPKAFEPKYAPEPQSSHSMRPGKIFRMEPGQKEWREVHPDIDKDIPDPVQSFFKEVYVFTYDEGGERCTVTIHGDPQEPKSRITVEKKDMEYSATIEAIDELPKDIRDKAERGLEEARKRSRQKSRGNAWRQHSQTLKDFWHNHVPEGIDKSTQDYMDRARRSLEQWHKSHGSPAPMVDKDRQRIEQLEKELQSLRKRLDALENDASSRPLERSEI